MAESGPSHAPQTRSNSRATIASTLSSAGVDLGAVDAGAIGLRRELNFVHPAEQVFEFAVGFALDRHATKIADVAFVIAAGIKRQNVACRPLGRRVRD